jgi:hypothetical protein
LDSSAYVPGNSRSIARQFIRCVLHQLSANGISSKIFLLEMEEKRRQSFFGTLVQVLVSKTEKRMGLSNTSFVMSSLCSVCWTSPS